VTLRKFFVKKVVLALLIIQCLGAFAAAIAATIELETILISGPLLSLIGWLFAWMTIHQHSWASLIYGLSAPLTCTLCAVLIAIFRWGPDWNTGWPIAMILVLYAILLSPLAAVVYFTSETSEWIGRPPATWQFDMKWMLGLMTGICLLTVAARFLVGLQNEEAVFGGFALVCTVLSILVVRRFRTASGQ
jgi:hypothetical protein